MGTLMQIVLQNHLEIGNSIVNLNASLQTLKRPIVCLTATSRKRQYTCLGRLPVHYRALQHVMFLSSTPRSTGCCRHTKVALQVTWMSESMFSREGSLSLTFATSKFPDLQPQNSAVYPVRWM